MGCQGFLYSFPDEELHQNSLRKMVRVLNRVWWYRRNCTHVATRTPPAAKGVLGLRTSGTSCRRRRGRHPSRGSDTDEACVPMGNRVSATRVRERVTDGDGGDAPVLSPSRSRHRRRTALTLVRSRADEGASPLTYCSDARPP